MSKIDTRYMATFREAARISDELSQPGVQLTKDHLRDIYNSLEAIKLEMDRQIRVLEGEKRGIRLIGGKESGK